MVMMTVSAISTWIGVLGVFPYSSTVPSGWHSGAETCRGEFSSRIVFYEFYFIVLFSAFLGWCTELPENPTEHMYSVWVKCRTV